VPATASAPSESSRASTRIAFVWLATALSIAAFLAAALAAHLIVLLQAAGLTAREAVLVSSLIGPMQMPGRIAEFGFTRRLSPLRVGALAFVLMAAWMATLALVNGFSPVAFVFAILYGWSNGVMTIVRGTVPAALFGRRNYGALLGRLALPAFVARALAPLAFTLVLAAGLSREAALWSLFAGAAFALVGYRQAIRGAGHP
jgi:hypothetical protein